jgi:catechol 2,3-dioxygenase-like lactoylglutathione lyase family enzyme
MKPAAVLESALYVDNLEKAEAFYRDVLGLDCVGKTEGRHVFFRCSASIVLLFDAAATSVSAPNSKLPVPVHGASGQGHLCFRATSDEMDRWIVRLNSHGIAIEADFIWPAGGRSIYFRDPSGNSLEFGEPKIWGLV